MSRRNPIAATFLFLAFAAPVHAGMANADLTCRMRDPSAPGFTLEGNVPGNQADFALTIAAAGKQTRYADDGSGGGDGIAVVDDLDYGVFTLSIWRDDVVELTLYALPKSVRKGKAPDGRERFEFNALLRSAPTPGAQRGQYGYDSHVQDLVLRCTHDYGV